ncbi:amidohydrolase [Acidaminobacter hydrogenoformans]|uniref:Amidohydrolase 3 domain-containing protein n=1 Tax=Acidaminobacter hydrogenoformans DSM 2784 TaxID=1120920 RepID=A0A1G5RWX6_9FIRM|nr:amidohydrolase [Acidaminobacter hydrogenoformans]SCZ78614.1 hypothetical protein SAMN03080599_01348 [Acidaminobacter hydrogenoformans DSM 2784]
MQQAKKLFVNGRIFTANPEQPYASAMLIQNGKIEWIGDEASLDAALLSPETNIEKTDLQDRRVLPGLIDAHMHPVYLASAAKQIACTPPALYSIEEMIGQIREKREAQGPGVWIEGWGYDEGKLKEGRTPTRHDLDRATTDAPVSMMRTCAHIYTVNSLALKLAGIDRSTADPAGGAIGRDADGEPNGILYETARELLFKALPEKKLAETAASLADLSRTLLSQGITGVTEMFARTGPTDYYDLYTAASQAGFRQRAALYYIWDDLKTAPPFAPERRDHSQPIFVGGVKTLADGSVSGRTAWVNPPFLANDQSGGETSDGMATITPDELRAAGAYAKTHDLQLLTHAMGERAIDMIVDTFYKQENAPKLRIEHAAMPTPKALEQSAEMGVAYVNQPVFLFAEIESYLNNLGHKRTKNTYPVRSVLDAGIQLAFSSDAPATSWADPSNPFVGIQAAVTRTSYDGTDHGQQHRVDPATAVSLYTREASKVVGFPGVGQLATGYAADFILLDRDIMEVAPETIGKTQVLETYMSGERVYNATEE